MNAYASGPYRSRQRVFCGVCRGLADYCNFSVFWTRVLVTIAFICTSFWPIGAAYLLLALLMKTEPYGRTAPCSTARENRGPAKNRGGLDERIRRMEDAVHSKQYDWDERLQRG